MSDRPRTLEAGVERPSRAWTLVLAIFITTSVIEAMGISQVFAFMPLYLAELGLPASEIPRWVGALGALVFVFGLPLVPLWGVWADKYSRKVVILRSALVEAVMFTFIALSRQPWQLAGSMLLAGFQLGNSGVMLAAMREVTPQRRLGVAIALFGATWPVGSAVGPALGGVMIDGLHTPISYVYLLAALLSAASAALLAVGFREVRPERSPSGSVLELAHGAMRGVFTDPTTRRLFTIFGIALLGGQMARPFLPIAVEQVSGVRQGLAGDIALVVGAASLAGGLISPVAGAVGDRMGFRPVLAVSLVGSGLALAALPFAPAVGWLAGINAILAVLGAAVSAMIFSLLALEVPPERRSTTLNLVYLPLYLAGIAGPAIGAVVVGAGLAAVFLLGGLLLGASSLLAIGWD
jgi:MFS family permease